MARRNFGNCWYEREHELKVGVGKYYFLYNNTADELIDRLTDSINGGEFPDMSNGRVAFRYKDGSVCLYIHTDDKEGTNYWEVKFDYDDYIRILKSLIPELCSEDYVAMVRSLISEWNSLPRE